MAEPQQEQHETRPSKRARKAAAGPFQLATDARGAAEQERLEGIRRQQEEAARAEAEFKVRAVGDADDARLLACAGAAGLHVVPGPHTTPLCAPSLQALPLNKAALAGAWKPAPLAVAALTVPQEVQLRSDARAARRAEFDHSMAAKQAQLDAERAALLAQHEAQEEEEERALRRRLGHKPLPLPDRL